VQEVQQLLTGREAAELHVDLELERCGHRRRQEVGRGHRGKRDEVDPVLVAIQPVRRRLEGQARLADTARPDQREEAAGRVVEEPIDRGQLLRPADERGPRGGEVRAPGLERPERRELGGQAVDLELEDPLRSAEVPEPVRPEVPGVHLDESPGGLGQEDLAAVADGGDAGGPVDVEPDVAFLGQPRLAGVEAHPDLDRTAGQRPLGFRGCADRVRGPGERDEESVALGVDLDPAVRGDGSADDPAMLGQGLRVRIARLAQQPGGTLDVGEQEGDHTGRQLAGHR